MKLFVSSLVLLFLQECFCSFQYNATWQVTWSGGTNHVTKGLMHRFTNIPNATNVFLKVEVVNTDFHNPSTQYVDFIAVNHVLLSNYCFPEDFIKFSQNSYFVCLRDIDVTSSVKFGSLDVYLSSTYEVSFGTYNGFLLNGRFTLYGIPIPTSQPTGQPSGQPTRQPSCQPTSQPSRQPSIQPTTQPSDQPSGQPSSHPSDAPSITPSSQPSTTPSDRPTAMPSSSFPTTYPTYPVMAPFEWVGGSGFWNSKWNWNRREVPDKNSTVILNLKRDVIVTITASISIQNLNYSGSGLLFLADDVELIVADSFRFSGGIIQGFGETEFGGHEAFSLQNLTSAVVVNNEMIIDGGARKQFRFVHVTCLDRWLVDGGDVLLAAAMFVVPVGATMQLGNSSGTNANAVNILMDSSWSYFNVFPNEVLNIDVDINKTLPVGTSARDIQLMDGLRITVSDDPAYTLAPFVVQSDGLGLEYYANEATGVIDKVQLYSHTFLAADADECARVCLSMNTSHCRSFDYHRVDSRCQLSVFNLRGVGGLTSVGDISISDYRPALLGHFEKIIFGENIRSKLLVEGALTVSADADVNLNVDVDIFGSVVAEVASLNRLSEVVFLASNASIALDCTSTVFFQGKSTLVANSSIISQCSGDSLLLPVLRYSLDRHQIESAFKGLLSVVVDNAAVTIVPFIGQGQFLDVLQIDNYGMITVVDQETPLILNNLTMNNFARLTGSRLMFSVTDTVYVGSTATITTTGMGYPRGLGPGVGVANKFGASGGSYGGSGGSAEVDATSIGYGSVTIPIDLGSGGGVGFDRNQFPDGSDGYGGGVIHIHSKYSVVMGDIACDGNSGYISGGGGSGGSLLLNSTIFSGSGKISVKGGDGGYGEGFLSGGGGSGGRIAIYAQKLSFSGTIQSGGGKHIFTPTDNAAQIAAAGTVFIESAADISIPKSNYFVISSLGISNLESCLFSNTNCFLDLPPPALVGSEFPLPQLSIKTTTLSEDVSDVNIIIGPNDTLQLAGSTKRIHNIFGFESSRIKFISNAVADLVSDDSNPFIVENVYIEMINCSLATTNNVLVRANGKLVVYDDFNQTHRFSKLEIAAGGILACVSSTCEISATNLIFSNNSRASIASELSIVESNVAFDGGNIHIQTPSMRTPVAVIRFQDSTNVTARSSLISLANVRMEVFGLVSVSSAVMVNSLAAYKERYPASCLFAPSSSVHIQVNSSLSVLVALDSDGLVTVDNLSDFWVADGSAGPTSKFNLPYSSSRIHIHSGTFSAAPQTSVVGIGSIVISDNGIFRPPAVFSSLPAVEITHNGTLLYDSAGGYGGSYNCTSPLVAIGGKIVMDTVVQVSITNINVVGGAIQVSAHAELTLLGSNNFIAGGFILGFGMLTLAKTASLHVHPVDALRIEEIVFDIHGVLTVDSSTVTVTRNAQINNYGTVTLNDDAHLMRGTVFDYFQPYFSAIELNLLPDKIAKVSSELECATNCAQHLIANYESILSLGRLVLTDNVCQSFVFNPSTSICYLYASKIDTKNVNFPAEIPDRTWRVFRLNENWVPPAQLINHVNGSIVSSCLSTNNVNTLSVVVGNYGQIVVPSSCSMIVDGGYGDAVTARLVVNGTMNFVADAFSQSLVAQILGSGTIYFSENAGHFLLADIAANDLTLVVQNAAIVSIGASAGTFTLKKLIVTGASLLRVLGPHFEMVVDHVIVNSSSTLTTIKFDASHYLPVSSSCNGCFDLIVTSNDVTVALSSKIHVNRGLIDSSRVFIDHSATISCSGIYNTPMNITGSRAGDSYGGSGGSGGYAKLPWPDIAPSPAGSYSNPDHSHRSFSHSAGALVVNGTILTLDGSIQCNGATPMDAILGGGSGGTVIITVASVSGSGSISANGGNGGRSSQHIVGQGGGGGGGRISIHYHQFATNLLHLATSFGGTGFQNGSPGTVYLLNSTSSISELLVSAGTVHSSQTTHIVSTPNIALTNLRLYSNCQVVVDVPVFQVSNVVGDGTASMMLNPNSELRTSNSIPSDLIIENYTLNVRQGKLVGYQDLFVKHNGKLILTDSALTLPHNKSSHYYFGRVTVQHMGTIVYQYDFNNLDPVRRVLLHAAVSIIVDFGGLISATGMGYSGSLSYLESQYPRHNPGQGHSEATGGGGGGFGGIGGRGFTADPGSQYGNISFPLEFGGGGGAAFGHHSGGNGGGIVYLQAPSLTLHGKIEANGVPGYGEGGGGGSGGGILIQVDDFDGTGLVTANGGDGLYSSAFLGGGGGGGRVAIHCLHCSQPELTIGGSCSDFVCSGQVSAAGGRYVPVNGSPRDYEPLWENDFSVLADWVATAGSIRAAAGTILWKVQKLSNPSSIPTSLPSQDPTSQPSQQPSASPSVTAYDSPIIQVSLVPFARVSHAVSGVSIQVSTSVPYIISLPFDTVSTYFATSVPIESIALPSSTPSGIPSGEPTGQPSSAPTSSPTGSLDHIEFEPAELFYLVIDNGVGGDTISPLSGTASSVVVKSSPTILQICDAAYYCPEGFAHVDLADGTSACFMGRSELQSSYFSAQDYCSTHSSELASFSQLQDVAAVAAAMDISSPVWIDSVSGVSSSGCAAWDNLSSLQQNQNCSYSHSFICRSNLGLQPCRSLANKPSTSKFEAVIVRNNGCLTIDNGVSNTVSEQIWNDGSGEVVVSDAAIMIFPETLSLTSNKLQVYGTIIGAENLFLHSTSLMLASNATWQLKQTQLTHLQTAGNFEWSVVFLDQSSLVQFFPASQVTTVTIRCNELRLVDIFSKLSVDYGGYTGALQDEAYSIVSTTQGITRIEYGDGGWHAGRGGGVAVDSKQRSLGNAFFPDQPGIGGGASSQGPGGRGGGALRAIIRDVLVNNGAISADGEACPPMPGGLSGGGSGGSIWITVNGSITGSGTYSVTGGDGCGEGGGGGSGGRVAIHVKDRSYQYRNQFRLHPGGQQNVIGRLIPNAAAAGTAYIGNEIGMNGQLIIGSTRHPYQQGAHGSSIFGNAHNTLFDFDIDTLNLNGSVVNLFGNATLRTDRITSHGLLSTVNVTGFSLLDLGHHDLHISGYQLILHESTLLVGSSLAGSSLFISYSNSMIYNQTVPRSRLSSTSQVLLDSLTVESGGSIEMAESNNIIDTEPIDVYVMRLMIEPYAMFSCSASVSHNMMPVLQFGPLDLSAGGNYAGSGGGHAGFGSKGKSNPKQGQPRGDATQPTAVGEPGGNSLEFPGGFGGGACRITFEDSAVINGKLYSQGQPAAINSAAGGGAGGSIWLSSGAGTLSGSGSISVAGGNGGISQSSLMHGGAGSGGRILIDACRNNFTGNIVVHGGLSLSTYIELASDSNYYQHTFEAATWTQRNQVLVSGAAGSLFVTNDKPTFWPACGVSAPRIQFTSWSVAEIVGITSASSDYPYVQAIVSSTNVPSTNSFHSVVPEISTVNNGTTDISVADFDMHSAVVSIANARDLLYHQMDGFQSKLLISDSSGLIPANASLVVDGFAITIHADSLRGIRTVTVINGGILTIVGSNGPLAVESVVVRNGSSLVGKNISIIAETINVLESSAIHADYLGYASQSGPGQGTFSSAGGTGGGHGGVGGIGLKDKYWLQFNEHDFFPPVANRTRWNHTAVSCRFGSMYGSILQPTTAGSRGGQYPRNGQSGGRGGGVLHLQTSQSLEVDASSRVSANGESIFDGSGGGAGGSVWIELGTGKLFGGGLISAIGGSTCLGNNCVSNVAYPGGVGGGGRIHIDGFIEDFSGSIAARSGVQPGSKDVVLTSEFGTVIRSKKVLALILNKTNFDEHCFDVEFVQEPIRMVQVIETSTNNRTNHPDPTMIKGYWTVGYRNSVSTRILSSLASAVEVRLALSELPGLQHVTVSREENDFNGCVWRITFFDEIFGDVALLQVHGENLSTYHRRPGFINNTATISIVLQPLNSVVSDSFSELNWNNTNLPVSQSLYSCLEIAEMFVFNTMNNMLGHNCTGGWISERAFRIIPGNQLVNYYHFLGSLELVQSSLLLPTANGLIGGTLPSILYPNFDIEFTKPTSQPTSQPTRQPSGQPSSSPTSQPSSQPSSFPTQPSSQPSASPTDQPASSPTGQPTKQPSTHPSTRPTDTPTMKPSGQPTAQPSQPSGQPTSSPSGRPSSIPSGQPSVGPSCQPSGSPTAEPTTIPSTQPSGTPSAPPSSMPSDNPSNSPSSVPSFTPSAEPSTQPTCNPSNAPSSQPSTEPSSIPTSQPTDSPTASYTSTPTSGDTSMEPSSPLSPTVAPSGNTVSTSTNVTNSTA